MFYLLYKYTYYVVDFINWTLICVIWTRYIKIGIYTWYWDGGRYILRMPKVIKMYICSITFSSVDCCLHISISIRVISNVLFDWTIGINKIIIIIMTYVIINGDLDNKFCVCLSMKCNMNHNHNYCFIFIIECHYVNSTKKIIIIVDKFVLYNSFSLLIQYCI